MHTRILTGFAAFLALCALAFFVVFNAALRQDEDHAVMLRAIAKLHLSGVEMVKADDDTYVLRPGRSAMPFIDAMAAEGWEFKEQLGAAYMFEKDGTRGSGRGRMYSRYYYLIDAPEAP